jgi:hypothetical protein
VVALVGPNGAGKSTVLARIGGQLRDHGTVLLDDAPAPRGVRARARAGLARSWQRPPDVPPDDLLAVTLTDPTAERAARWAARTLGHDGPLADAPAGVLQLVVLAARGPAVALLDEPTDVPPDRSPATWPGSPARGPRCWWSTTGRRSWPSRTGSSRSKGNA